MTPLCSGHRRPLLTATHASAKPVAWLLALLVVLFPTLASAQSLAGKTVFWLGASIPEGCTYPAHACQALDMHCINHAVGSSYLSINPLATTGQEADGLSLSMSMDEKRALAGRVEGGIDNQLLNRWLRSSYENLIDPSVAAAPYHLPLLDAWNYTAIHDSFAPGSANYLDCLNQRYGTNFSKQWANAQGDITWFQKFCPNAVHPFTDPTGQSDRTLDSIFTFLLEKRLKEAVANVPSVSNYTVGSPTEIYGPDGIRKDNYRQGVSILRYASSKTLKIVVINK